MADSDDKIALLDLDGTVADYDRRLNEMMETLRSPDEPVYDGRYKEAPPHIEARRDLIKSQPGFWRNLAPLKLGFEVVGCVLDIGFQIMVLTKGSRVISSAWQEKFEWCGEHLPQALITITQKKSLVYGRVLIDDYPEYFWSWLDVRPRGLVIAVAQRWNEGINDPRVIRYDGTNLEQVRQALAQAYSRPGGQ